MRMKRIFSGGAWLGFVALMATACNSKDEPLVNTATGTAAGPVAWTQVFSGDADQVGWLVATTDSGQIVVAGTMQSKVDFGAGGQIDSVSENDIFVAWLERDGKVARVRRFGETGGHIPLGLAVDSAGGVILTGVMIGSIDFGGGLLESQGGGDAFIASFGANGDYRFAMRAGNAAEQRGGQIVLAEDGSIYWSGTFEGDIDIGGIALQSAGQSDMFVAKISPTGSPAWANAVGGPGFDGDVSMARLPNGQLLVSGFYEGAPDLGDGALPDTGMADGQVLVAIGDDGKFAWSRGVAHTSGYFPFSVRVDEMGAPWLIGVFAGAVDLFGTPMSTPEQGVALAKLDAGGAAVSTQVFPADQPGFVRAVPARGGGFVIAGDFEKSIDLAGQTLTSAGDNDIFVVWVDSDGRVTRRARSGGAGQERFGGVSMLPTGQVVITGGFDGTMNIGGAAYTSANGPDGYVLLLN